MHTLVAVIFHDQIPRQQIRDLHKFEEDKISKSEIGRDGSSPSFGFGATIDGQRNVHNRAQNVLSTPSTEQRQHHYFGSHRKISCESTRYFIFVSPP